MTPATVLTKTVQQSRTGGSTLILAPLGRAVNITTGRRHSCALIANGGVSCWGINTFGQLGTGSALNQLLTASAAPSFTLNIDPTVTFDRNGRVADVTVVATCEAGRRLFFDVSLTQGETSGRGSGTGKCTSRLERYPVTVPAQGRDPFLEGAARVSAGGGHPGRGVGRRRPGVDSPGQYHRRPVSRSDLSTCGKQSARALEEIT